MYTFHTFFEETRSIENTLKFEGQWVKAFQSVADIVVVLVCLIYTNLEVNILSTKRMGNRTYRNLNHVSSERDGGFDSGNYHNFNDDDEIGYKGTPQLEPTIAAIVEIKLVQPIKEEKLLR